MTARLLRFIEEIQLESDEAQVKFSTPKILFPRFLVTYKLIIRQQVQVLFVGYGPG